MKKLIPVLLVISIFFSGLCAFAAPKAEDFTAKAAILMEASSGMVLYEQNAYEYPVQMTEAPAVNMTFVTRNGLGAIAWVYSQDADTAQKYAPQAYLIRPTTATGIHGNLNVIGKGKYE